MKRLILFELIVLFLATTFESDSPPGWFQQVLPVNKFINDIYFKDSLTGWAVTLGATTATDTGYIFRTINGGTNWYIEFQGVIQFNAIQYIDNSTGYAVGSTGSGKVYKTTNGGNNWLNISTFCANPIIDLNFVNKDTGWICSDDPICGGLFKTANGGVNWTQQLNNSFKPLKVFFINKDTGWVGTNDANGRLFKTTDGGGSWNLMLTTTTPVEAVFFLNGYNGWIRGGTGNGCMYTTNGGFTWLATQGEVAGYDVKFVNDSIGYSGGSFMRVKKSTDGGKNWGYQNSPIFTALQTAIFKGDTMRGWMGTNGIIKTTDGGGSIIYTGIGINPNSGVIPSFNLKQNYPNPFNPSTIITFDVTRNSKISLKIFNMLGEEIDELIDYEDHNTGTFTVNYETDDDIPSGVYFYQITAWTENKKEIFIDTKKMILIK